MGAHVTNAIPNQPTEGGRNDERGERRRKRERKRRRKLGGNLDRPERVASFFAGSSRLGLRRLVKDGFRRQRKSVVSSLSCRACRVESVMSSLTCQAFPDGSVVSSYL